MPLERRDLARLRDIDIYASRALDYLAQAGNDVASSTLVQDAILRCFEVMGEAARATSAAAKSDYPSIPWPFIVGMRNRVIHEYHRVDLELVYQTIREDLPPLLIQIRLIIATEDPAGTP